MVCYSFSLYIIIFVTHFNRQVKLYASNFEIAFTIIIITLYACPKDSVFFPIPMYISVQCGKGRVDGIVIFSRKSGITHYFMIYFNLLLIPKCIMVTHETYFFVSLWFFFFRGGGGKFYRYFPETVILYLVY